MVAYREEEEDWVRGCGTSMAGETGAELLDANSIVLVWRLLRDVFAHRSGLSALFSFFFQR